MFRAFQLLLPALIPSWNFFDVIAASPRLEYAELGAPGEATVDWREFRPRPQRLSLARMLGRLLWNARWNETLFVVSCAERLLAEPTDHSEDEIFRRIAADLADVSDQGAGWVRFRIVLVSATERSVGFVSEPRALTAISIR